MKKNKYLDLIKNEPVVIGRLLGFEDLKEIHNEWLKLMMFERVDRTLLAHRGSYKTTCLSIAIGLTMIVYPNKNIIFIRKTDVDVTEVVKQVSKMLQSELIRHIVRQLYGVELVLVKDTSFELTTNLRTSARGASQLLGLGIKTSITGKHADLVITDDIVNIKDRISKAERDVTSMSYMELQNIKNRGGKRTRQINKYKEYHDLEMTQLKDKEYIAKQSTAYIRRLRRAHSDFNEKIFEGLYQYATTGDYMTMRRVSEDKTKIVVKVASEHLLKTKYGWGLVLDDKHVVWLKNWQVNENWYGNEVLLNKAYFNVKEWGNHEAFGSEPQNLKWETWVDTAKAQKGEKVKWRSKETSAQRENSLFGHGKYYS